MKTYHHHRTMIAPARLVLLAGVCLLVLGSSLRTARASAKEWADDTARSAQPTTRVAALPAAVPASPLRAAPTSQTQAPTLLAQNSTAAPASAPPANPPSGAAAPAGDKTLYSFQANDLDLKSALASFARANSLNIVPDNDVEGVITLDVRDLPLQQMMRALLEAADCSWDDQGGLIRVHAAQTRTFPVDYLRLTRTGFGNSSAQLGSGGSGGGSGGGSSGGMGGGGGGGMGGGGGGGSSGGSSGGSGGSSGGSSVLSYGSSSVNIMAQNSIEFWSELKKEIGFLLTERGKQSMAINMTAGLIQVTDRPSAIKNVEEYLRGVDKSIHRQVDIEALIYSVTLNNQFQFGIDWVGIATAAGGVMGYGGATLPTAIGGTSLGNSALNGLNTAFPGGMPIAGAQISTLVFSNFNGAAAVNALESQGKVEVISKPRLRTLNNQTALIKVGEDKPFFNTSAIIQQGNSLQPLTSESTIVSSVTIGTILSLTPQISEDGYITIDISPVLTSLIGTVYAPASGSSTNNASTSGTTAPDLETKQASTLVRVRDGTTVVLGGLIQTQLAKNRTKIPLLGDIPLLGVLFTGTFDYKQKQELVIFVTPHIIQDDEFSARIPAAARPNSIHFVEPH